MTLRNRKKTMQMMLDPGAARLWRGAAFGGSRGEHTRQRRQEGLRDGVISLRRARRPHRQPAHVQAPKNWPA